MAFFLNNNDNNKENGLDTVGLTEEIKKELGVHFEKIDEQIVEYLVSVIDVNRDDFNTVEDIQDAVGPILNELANGEKDDQFISELCGKFYEILKCTDSNEINGSNSEDLNEIRQLSAPVTIGDLCRNDSSKDDNSWFDLKPENMTRVDPKKLEKAEAKLQKKKDKASSSKDLVYDAAQAASASQSLSRKSENQQNSEANRSFDIIIENFDVAFGNKFLF